MDDIKVGDRVRSYDFPGTTDKCYVEGVVERIGPVPADSVSVERYHIKADKRVFDGKEVTVDNQRPYYYPPVNGSPGLFTLHGTGVTDGVKLIKAGSAT